MSESMVLNSSRRPSLRSRRRWIGRQLCWLEMHIRSQTDTRNRVWGDLHHDYHWQSHERPSYPRAA